jgi:hypothetical protein
MRAFNINPQRQYQSGFIAKFSMIWVYESNVYDPCPLSYLTVHFSSTYKLTIQTKKHLHYGGDMWWRLMDIYWQKVFLNGEADVTVNSFI